MKWTRTRHVEEWNNCGKFWLVLKCLARLRTNLFKFFFVFNELPFLWSRWRVIEYSASFNVLNHRKVSNHRWCSWRNESEPLHPFHPLQPLHLSFWRSLKSSRNVEKLLKALKWTIHKNYFNERVVVSPKVHSCLINQNNGKIGKDKIELNWWKKCSLSS